jgi:hypothetical protein
MRSFLAAGALVLAFCAGSAAAATHTVTATGIILPGGFDDDGRFGSPGASLAGASFTATLTFDPRLGTLAFEDADAQEVEGAITSASIRINGVAYDFPALGRANPSNDISFDAALDDQFTIGDGLGTAITLGFPAGLGRIAQRGAVSGDHQDGSFDIGLDGTGGGSFGALDLKTFTVSAAPEPATWALLLTGAFAAGAILRRKRRYDRTALRPSWNASLPCS